LFTSKEANNIEDEPLEGGNVQVFRIKEKERLRIIGRGNVMRNDKGLIEKRDGG
jgi:hypothetical protein